MNVMASAAQVGITRSDGSAVSGTIDVEAVVLALLDLELDDPRNADLYSAATARVRAARSAGTERIDADSIFARQGRANDMHLRYRSEMADLFLDLAIDVGMRERQPEDAAV